MNMSLNDYMIENNIPGIQGVDTRAITRILRKEGCMNGMITTKDYEVSEVIDQIKAFKIQGVVEKCSCLEPYHVGQGDYEVALYDFGAKRNIARELAKRGCHITVLPADTPAQYVIDHNFDGIMLSNGPGDPSECTEIIDQLKILASSGIPIFAICLGHQLLALAHGFETEKMVYGHHGSNHPIKDLTTGRVYISTQNHNYVIKEDTIDPKQAKVWFKNVNDKTIEGLEYLKENIKSVQFHPEACGGPHDTEYLFDSFIEMMGEHKNA